MVFLKVQLELSDRHNPRARDRVAMVALSEVESIETADEGAVIHFRSGRSLLCIERFDAVQKRLEDLGGHVP